jgi:hypothetical protein
MNLDCALTLLSANDSSRRSRPEGQQYDSTLRVVEVLSISSLGKGWPLYQQLPHYIKAGF